MDNADLSNGSDRHSVIGQLGMAAIRILFRGQGFRKYLLRPRLVGRDTQMPDLLILISTLGGISLFGAPGFIVGPLVAAFFITLWQILAETYRPPVAKE